MLKHLGNIRFQIALLLLLVIVPLASVAVYLAVDDGRKEAARARADSRTTVRLVAQELNRVIQSSRDVVLGFSHISVTRDRGECNTRLASLAPAFPQFANMVVVDADYTVVCAASNPMNVRTIPRGSDEVALMDRVLRSRQIAVGKFKLTTPGKRVLPLMGPIFDDDRQVRSFFRVTLDLGWLEKQVSSVALPAEAVLLVMDGDGTEIARNPRSVDWPAGTPAPPLERTLVGRRDFNAEIKGYDGIGRFYSVAGIGAGEELRVVMKTRIDKIYRPAERRLALHLFGLACLGLLGLGLAWRGSGRYFLHPLSRLIQTANLLAAGSLASRSGLEYTGEIGRLAQSFDQMADTLERNRAQERLFAAREAARLRRLKKLSELSMMLAGDPAVVFQNIVRLIGELFEARAVCLSEIVDEDISFRAIYANGKVVSNAGKHPLAVTPCGGVAASGDIRIYEGVQRLFPRATFLKDINAEAWCGVPSLDSQGKVVAVTCLVDDKPRAFTEEDKQILVLIGQRIAAEFERFKTINERARMEEELRENKRRLEQAQQMAQLGSYTGDETSGRIEWSDELYRIYEIDPADGPPSRDALLARVHPDDRALVQETIAGSKSEKGSFHVEHRLLMPDGWIKFLLVQGTVSSGADGRPVTRGTVQDITDRKRDEEDKSKLQAQLNQAQKMDSIGRLAGGVAHDFNNLLTVINGYSEVLTHQLDGSFRQYAEQINKAGESAASLTRQLLSFSRMDVARGEPVLLNNLVAESQDMLGRLVGGHVEIKTSLQAELDGVLADSNQIHQCLMNLVVNARDAMPAGGCLTIESANVEVTPADLPPGSGATPGPYVRLSVRDTGVGMDEVTTQRIFEPFFTTKEIGRGTGLGLSTVYGIVNQWHGFLRVVSAPGQGSEFGIYLPLNETANAMRPARDVEASVSPAVAATLLVVEDQDLVREFVVASLRLSGYDVLEARGGEDALKIIDRHADGPIDLLITDVLMPGMRGKELAARAGAKFPSMKVLFMTGYSDDSIDFVGRTEARDEVIMKPFAPEVLETRVRDLLRHPENPKDEQKAHDFR